MYILKKTPRAHGPNEPFKHENHPRPVTRRELIGAGFLSGGAMVMAPAWLGALLKSQKADAATLSSLSQLQTECALQTPANGGGALGTTGPVPFITIDLAGGANLMGSEAIAGMAGSPTNFISTAGFNKQGVPGSMVPTSSAFIDMSLGLPFHSDSAILRGIKSKASATALAKVNGVVIPAISQNDTNSNPLNAMYFIAEAVNQLAAPGQLAPAYGQYATLVGTNATTSGGNSAAPAISIDPTLQPTRIASSADNLSLIGSSGATGAASQATVDVQQAQAAISTGTVQAPNKDPKQVTSATFAGTTFYQAREN